MEVATINFNGSHGCDGTWRPHTLNSTLYTKFVVQVGLGPTLTVMFSLSYQPQQKGYFH